MVYELSQELWLYAVEHACHRRSWRTMDGQSLDGEEQALEAEVLQ
jgi:hypothetical protein